jgi:glycosyltransferase involved in cell wall biosynthesis
MNIAIVNNCVPFIYGGAESLADSLKDKLNEYGHRTTVIKIPFKWHPAQRILEHMLACRLLRIDNADLVVALKFPVYYLKHPNKVIWLLHQFRQAYDMWGTPYQSIPNTAEGLQIRQSIVHADTLFLKEARHIYTISKVVSGRLKKYNDIDSNVLYPPLSDASKYDAGEYGDYIFYPSRINRAKRQHLAVEAMKYVRSAVKLIIAGNPDTQDEVTGLRKYVEEHNLQERVMIFGRWISEEEKRGFFSKALGCIFVPYQEDYGYVSLEALYSRKAVITCTDSGGSLEFIDHMVNGFTVEPNPLAIAEALDNLYRSRSLAIRMGQSGYDKICSMDISWDNVISRLVQ